MAKFVLTVPVPEPRRRKAATHPEPRSAAYTPLHRPARTLDEVLATNRWTITPAARAFVERTIQASPKLLPENVITSAITRGEFRRIVTIDVNEGYQQPHNEKKED